MQTTTASDPCSVVELRQYTLHPGQRDTLIELFDREFVETQEAAGMTVMGQFRDLDHADRFVWLRGFADMPERAEALAAFYDGPVWAAHRSAANATMIDSDDVLLLRPAQAGSGLSMVGRTRAAPGVQRPHPGLVALQVCPLRADATDDPDDAAEVFNKRVAPSLARAGVHIAGLYVTEPGANTFLRLPVREGVKVLVWLSVFSDAHAHARCAERLAADPAWRDGTLPAWNRRLSGPTQTLRLAPTARSRLHAGVKLA